MTLRPLPRARLERLVPPLTHRQALIALVPVSADLEWTAAVAWAIARAAARDGRRVALVDLWIDDPHLHHAAGLTPAEGIVDAFEYGVSLTKAAREVDGVFFISAGSCTASAGDLLAHERWRKLHAGFRSEDALLVLYLSPESLARLATVADGVMILAPKGVDPESSTTRAVVASARGAPVLGVVGEQFPEGVPRERVVSPPRRRRTALAGLGLAAAAAAGWALLARSEERPAATPPPPALSPSPAAPQPADTTPWTVQMAAYGTLEGALQHADALADEQVPALVAPVLLGGSSSAWYRVLVGSFPSRDAAAAARSALWARGVAPEGLGDLLRAPYSLAVAASPAPDSLRRLGIPVLAWPDGRLLVGAFETPEQAAFAEGLLARVGAQATLISRTGTTP